MPSTPPDSAPIEAAEQPRPEAEHPHAETEHPRLIEEHLAPGAYRRDDLEATDELGRRWYHLRPQPRGRYDMVGFNWTWWLIWIMVVFIIFLPWGHGWGY